MTVQILKGDCRDVLRTLPAESVHCVVTSPPYWGLRDYGVESTVWGGNIACEHDFEERRWYTEQSAAKTNGSIEAFSKPGAANAQRLKDARWRTDGTCVKCGAWHGSFGLEPTYQLYVEHAVEVFREVRRVLRDNGTLWLNLGDSYNSGPSGGLGGSTLGGGQKNQAQSNRAWRNGSGRADGVVDARAQRNRNGIAALGLKPKDMIGIPWRIAFALQADGWYLRQDIIWHKPNPMPESVTDRCTKSHEYIFMLTKSARYYYDADAISEDGVKTGTTAHLSPGKGSYQNVQHTPKRSSDKQRGHSRRHAGFNDRWDKMEKAEQCSGKRNKRSVWMVATHPYSEAHFATFPPALIEPCILAGCPEDGTVLDPFGGAGTTGMVADRLGRNAILIELNPEYADMAERRISGDGGMFSQVTTKEGDPR